MWTSHGPCLNLSFSLISVQASHSTSTVQVSQHISLLLLVIHNKFSPAKRRAEETVNFWAKVIALLRREENRYRRTLGMTSVCCLDVAVGWLWCTEVYFSVAAHLCLHKFDGVMYDICVRNSQESSPKLFVSTVARADSPQFLFEFLFKIMSWSFNLHLYKVWLCDNSCHHLGCFHTLEHWWGNRWFFV